MEKLKLAVYGKTRSGKSSVCQVIHDYFSEGKNQHCEIFDFSDNLKKSLNVIFPYLDRQVKHRTLLISLGQKLRELDEDVWVKALEYNINNTKADIIIVTGVRQPNEYNFLKRNNFIFIKVEASTPDRIQRCIANNDNFNIENLNDNTEKHLDKFKYDYLINNCFSLKDLEIEALNTLSDILHRRIY